MNQHTPQEWADITGCYVVRDQLRERFTLFKNKPEIDHEEGLWYQTGDWGELPVEAVPKEFKALDWTILYEPRKRDNAPHQSVKEYVLVTESDPDRLAAKVTGMLKDGWNLYENPFTDSGGILGYFIYQAMIREKSYEQDV